MNIDVYERIPVMESDKFMLREIIEDTDAEDYFNNCGMLRLDLRSDYEKQDMIEDILAIIIPKTKELFSCEMIATKAIPMAKERIRALENMGFCLSDEFVVGHNGTKYDSYYVL